MNFSYKSIITGILFAIIMSIIFYQFLDLYGIGIGLMCGLSMAMAVTEDEKEDKDKEKRIEQTK